ncbi:MAG: DUF86 domain-containing protein [Thermodesulfobacteriota bacterium]
MQGGCGHQTVLAAGAARVSPARGRRCLRDHALYLRDILAALDSIEAFVLGMDVESFAADDKTVSAVIRKLEIIGEAAKHIPEAVRGETSIPWKEMAGMRDKLIHFYFGVDHHLVWKTVRERLPGVRSEIRKLLEQSEA